jgi:cystathionine beta-lyase family protein involved in aluminum resistance
MVRHIQACSSLQHVLATICEGLCVMVADVRVALVQRSCGYADRPTLTIAEIQQVVAIVKRASPDCFVVVDNCYGEFTEAVEPCAVSLLHHFILALRTARHTV